MQPDPLAISDDITLVVTRGIEGKMYAVSMVW